MLFGVRDKEFDITFVNNFCREEYQRMLDLVDELTDLPTAVDEVADSNKLNEREKAAAMRALRQKQRTLVREIARARETIVRELLETNGYEFEERWWSRHTDADDMNTFALGCLRKDVKGGAAPKKG